MEWWQTLLISIASAIAGGLITGLFTFFIERRKLKHQDQQYRKEELKKEYDERPRLELSNFKDLRNYPSTLKCDCEVIVLGIEKLEREDKNFKFYYDEKALDSKNISCVDYEFVNTGRTEIEDICVVCNQQRIASLIEFKNRSFLIEKKTLNYEAWSEKRHIKPGEKVSLRMCYIKDKIIFSPTSAIAGIYMVDINGVLWHQPLFSPKRDMDNSTKASHKAFKDLRSVGLALECFENPYLW